MQSSATKLLEDIFFCLLNAPHNHVGRSRKKCFKLKWNKQIEWKALVNNLARV